MRKLVLLITLILCSAADYAQSVNMDSLFEPKLRGELYHLKKGTLGSQFYNDDWQKGDIKLSSGEVVYNKQLKYNVLLDELIWMQSGNFRQVKLARQFIREFSLENENGNSRRFIKMRIKLPFTLDSMDVFAEVLIEKAASLYAYRAVRIEGTVNDVNGIPCYFDKIVPQPWYIFVLPDSETILFKKINRRFFMKSLPEKYRNKVKVLLQQNHLSLRTEMDLAKLAALLEPNE